MKKEREGSFMFNCAIDSGQSEAVIDFVLIWTLNCAQKGAEIYENEQLGRYSKMILSLLLFDDALKIEQQEYTVESVETWRQWAYTDIWAEITLKNKQGKKENYALLIEDKAYTHVGEGQLEKYKKLVDSHYEGSDYTIRYVLCTLSNKVPPKDKALAKKNDFWSYSLADIAKMLRKNGAERTGNHLFDEFWMDQWG